MFPTTSPLLKLRKVVVSHLNCVSFGYFRSRHFAENVDNREVSCFMMSLPSWTTCGVWAEGPCWFGSWAGTTARNFLMSKLHGNVRSVFRSFHNSRFSAELFASVTRGICRLLRFDRIEPNYTHDVPSSSL